MQRQRLPSRAERISASSGEGFRESNWCARPEYDGWIAKFPHTQPLDSKQMVDAFRIWDQQVGTQKTK